MNVTVDIMNASGEQMLPTQDDFQDWSLATMLATMLGTMNELDGKQEDFELSIRVIDEAESAELNEQYRQKSGATNILSFPFDAALSPHINFLGDLAICAPVVRKESEEQAKTLQAHWAHMTVHGVLHLNSYDHEEPLEAEIMENLERQILKKLGFADPYQ